ncbi:MAG: zinc-ribbon domain-containing protein [Eubacteriales bacterium]|nr:zinc-ribbon domain-containing protein [Eubacteriales bacterium]
MKCRKCGSPVRESDRFCSVCGARVIREPLSASRMYKAKKASGRRPERKAEETTETKPGRYVPPEEFIWDTGDFPGAPRPTKDVDFNWNTFDDFHRKTSEAAGRADRHHDGEEIAFAPSSSAQPEEAAKDAADAETVPPSAGMHQGGAAADEQAAPEGQAVPEEPPVQSPAAVDESAAQAKPEEEKDETDEAPGGKKIVWKDPLEEMPLPREERAAAETVLEDAMTAKSLREDSPADTPEEQDVQVDQFYTFNKKNAEFQRLLDKEYEKYRAGRFSPEEDRREADAALAIDREDDLLDAYGTEPSDEEGVSASGAPADGGESTSAEPIPAAASPAEAGHTGGKAAPAGEVPSGSSDEEMAAEAAGKDGAADTMPQAAGQDNQNTQHAADGETRGEEASGSTSAAREEAAEETAGKAAAAGENGEGSPGQAVQSKKKDAGEKPAAAKSGWRALIIVLLVIALILAVFSATAAFAPESGAGRAVRSLIGLSQSAQRPVPEKAEAASPKKDKTGLIQLEIGQNKDDILGEIKYDQTLHFKKGTKYADKDIRTSHPMKSNPLWRRKGGEEIRMDRALTGTVIAYAAAHGARQDGTSVLRIGEYRQKGSAWFAWTALDSSRQVCRIEKKKGRLKVVRAVSL